VSAARSRVRAIALLATLSHAFALRSATVDTIASGVLMRGEVCAPALAENALAPAMLAVPGFGRPTSPSTDWGQPWPRSGLPPSGAFSRGRESRR
jgi:hypothetical protein